MLSEFKARLAVCLIIMMENGDEESVDHSMLLNCIAGLLYSDPMLLNLNVNKPESKKEKKKHK